MQTGQVMNGLIYSSNMAPKPNRNGFVVPSAAFTLFNACPCVKGTETSGEKPIIDALHLLRTAQHPLPGLCDARETANLHVCEDESEDDGTLDTSFSTDDSLGPSTPPQSRCGTPPQPVLLTWPASTSPSRGDYDEDSLFLSVALSAVDYLDHVSATITRSSEKHAITPVIPSLLPPMEQA
jgi:hypothetical protein